MQSLDTIHDYLRGSLRAKSENGFSRRTQPCMAPTKLRLHCFPGWCVLHIQHKPWQLWA